MKLPLTLLSRSPLSYRINLSDGRHFDITKVDSRLWSLDFAGAYDYVYVDSFDAALAAARIAAAAASDAAAAEALDAAGY